MDKQRRLSTTKAWALGGEKPRFGYRRLYMLLRQSGERVNHELVWHVYWEAGLCVKRKKRKRLVRADRPAIVLSATDQEWALDFLHEVLATGQRVRVLSVLDAYTRECLALEVDTSFANQQVTRVLEQVMEERGWLDRQLPHVGRCAIFKGNVTSAPVENRVREKMLKKAFTLR
ncbi:MAG: IS3 family transposase, partial [Acidobacteriia bacterium]|nr:IS3 family transposase [Terriglobia bacterium]